VAILENENLGDVVADLGRAFAGDRSRAMAESVLLMASRLVDL